MMKRTLSFLLALVLIFTLLSTGVFAASASFSLSASGSVTVGKQVKVTVKLSSSEKIGSWRFSISYDPAVLEYVSGADSGGGGAVSFADSSDGITSFSKTITFRAKKIGNATVSVGSAQVVSFDSATNMTVNSPSRKISVIAAPDLSGENHLSDLSVSAGEMTPAFSPDTNAYTLTVPYETTSVAVYATAKDGKASVAVTPSDALAVGENKIEVVVTAEDGSKRTYTLTVTRTESELAGATVDLDGVTYSVAYDPATLTVPENYTPATAEYGEKKILVFKAPKDVLQIAYLANGESGAWYIYDEETLSFSEYHSVTGAASTVVLLTPPESVKIPEGFLPHELTVGEETWSVYKSENSEEEGIWLVYGMKSDGTCQFFYYDSDLSTFASYFEPVKDTAAEEEAAKNMANLESLLQKKKDEADQMEILFLSAAVAATILLIVLIISLAARKKKKPKNEKEEKMKQRVPEESAPQNPEIPAAPLPKKRVARRTIEEIGHKEEVPSVQIDTAPALGEQKEVKAEQKSEDVFSGSDIPPILR